MQKFLRTLAMAVAMLLPFAAQAQSSWTVANGTTVHQYVPLDFYNTDGSGNHQAQMLYPASLLTDMSGSTIGAVTFYHQNTTATKTVNASTWYIRMGETTESDLTAGFSTETLTTVYSGILQVTNGVFTFELTSPYTYNGGNLIVEIQTSGANGNWFGSSGQGCFGVDNAGSTYSTMSSPNHTAFLPKTTFTEVPSCYPVLNLAIDATQTTTSSLTLTWSDSRNLNASYSVYTVTPTDTTLVEGGIPDMNYTVTNLEANTVYAFVVVADCGGGDLSQAVAVSGRTACAAVALPWSCSFEQNEIVGTSQAEALPFCSQRYTSAATSGTNYPYAYNYSTYARTGSRILYFYGTTSASYPDTMAFILPQVDVSTYMLSGARLTFWGRLSSSYNSAKNVYVCTMSDPADLSTLTLIDSVSVSGTAYTKYTVNLTSAGLNDSYVVLAVMKGSSTIYIDDMTLEEQPACGDVTGLTVAGVTSSTMTLSWATVAGVNGYSVYDAEGELVGSTVDTFYTVTGLVANTSYTFGVRSNCTAGDGAVSTVSGLTACGVVSMPWSENFNSWDLKSPCWSFLSGQLGTTATASTSAWSLTNSYGSNITLDGKALCMNLYDELKYWAVTPAVAITSDDAVLGVDVAVSAWYDPTPNYDDNDTLAFLASTDGGTTWTTLMVYDGTQLNALGNEYTTILVPVTGYNGQEVRFAIYGGSISGTSPYDNRIVIDNVTVGEAPDCMPVTGLTVSGITSHGAVLTWNGDADGYTVYNMVDTTVYEYANDTTVELYALDSETQYTFGVAANCGSEESDLRTVTFTTLISCPAPTDLAAALTPGDGTVATLNWHEAGEASEWQICLNGDMSDLISVYDTTHDLTGLTAEQAVTAKVRAICGADDTSSWSGEISFTPTNAYTITVNDGTTTNSYVPVYGLYTDDHIKSQFIIPAADLSAMAYGYINKLTFYSSDANKTWSGASFEVYLTETSETTVNSLASVSDMTQVYTGSLGIANNVMEITLTTPYQYMGGNLMIAFEQPTSGGWSGCNWYGVNATGASQGGYGTSVSQQNFLPKTTFAFTPGDEPLCMPVSGLAASGITADEATLSWNGDASSYNVYVVADGDTTYVQNVADATVTLTGLDAMTQYIYGVAAVCSGDESDLRFVTFNTACSAVTLPYTETFATTSATRNCWNLVSNNTANVGGTNGMGFVTVAGREVVRFSSYSSASDYNQYGFSPVMTVGDEATNLQVKVVYATYGSNDQLNFGYVTETDTVWDPTTYTTTGNSDWQSQTFVVPATATQLAVHYYGNFAYYGWIDSVVVTEMTGDYCAPVTALAVDSVSSTSVSLSWYSSAESFTVVNMADGSIVATATENNVTIENLTDATAYTFGVVTDCGTSTSDTVTIAARTACTNSCTVTISATDAYSDGWDASYIDVRQDGVSIAQLTIPYGGSSQTFNVSVCSGSPVAFAWVNMGGEYDEDVAFTITDGNNSQVFTTSDVTGYTSGAVFFTLADACPSCLMPVLTLDSVSETTATISWTSTAASFDVYNGSTAVATGISANTYTFTGLTAATGYTFGVVAHCDADDASQMATIDVATSCVSTAIALPFNETFSVTSGTRNCWTVIDGNNDGITWTTMLNGSEAEAMHSFSYDNATYTAITPNDWLISPLLHTTAGSALTLGWTVASAASYPAEHYGVYVSTTTADTASFTLVNEWTLNTGDATAMNVDLSTYAGQDIYVAFRHFNCNDQYVLRIDDVNVYAGAYVPDTLTVTFMVDDPTMGTTVPAPGVYQYVDGDTVFFGSQANAGYRFRKWDIIRDGVTDTLGSQYSNGYYIPASAWMQYDSVVFKAYFEVGAPDSMEVTLAVNNPTMGSITPAPGTYQYAEGSTITVDATPAAGYYFVGWQISYTYMGYPYEDMEETTDTHYEYTVMPYDIDPDLANYTITAVFSDGSAPEPDSAVFVIAVNDPAMGTTTPAPGTYVYHDGDVFSISATPNAGYHQESWIMSISSVGFTSIDTIPAFPGLFDSLDAQIYLGKTVNLTAVFAAGEISDSLTVITSVNNADWGTITPAPGTHMYAEGDVVSLGAQANDGYYLYALQVSINVPMFGTFDTVFSSIEDFYAEMEDSVIVVDATVLGATMSLNAIFQPVGVVPEEYTVSVNYNATMGNVLVNGQPAANGSSITVVEGSSVSFTANAYNNYEFVAWVDNGDTVGRQSVYTINSIDANHSVTAVFREKVGIADVDMDNVDIYSTDNMIVVRGAEGKQVVLFDVNGRMMSRMANAAERVEFRVDNSGVYLVKVANAAAKRVVVIR